jgi:hypothetical protein
MRSWGGSPVQLPFGTEIIVNSSSTPPALLPAIEPQALLPGLAVQTRVVAVVTAREWGQGPTLLLLHGGTGSWIH